MSPEPAPPYRQKMHACIHPETFKYFLPRDRVAGVWRELEGRYGPMVRNGSFGTIEIRGERLILRAVTGGNPITVIRRRGCSQTDIDELHRIFGFEGGP